MRRSADIPDKFKGKNEFSEVTIIVPGPREPKNLDIYLEPLLEDLQAFGPTGAVPATHHRRLHCKLLPNTLVAPPQCCGQGTC